jgi:hypothetical protein
MPQKLDTIWGIFYGKKMKYAYAFKLARVALVFLKQYSTSVSLRIETSAKT